MFCLFVCFWGAGIGSGGESLFNGTKSTSLQGVLSGCFNVVCNKCVDSDISTDDWLTLNNFFVLGHNQD